MDVKNIRRVVLYARWRTDSRFLVGQMIRGNFSSDSGGSLTSVMGGCEDSVSGVVGQNISLNTEGARDRTSLSTTIPSLQMRVG